MKRLTITNQKGGIGKTSVSVNLARFMSDSFNKKVLFFDFDVQGNASFSLNDYASNLTTYDFLMREITDQEVNKIIAMSSKGDIVTIKASDDLAYSDTFDPDLCVKNFNNNLLKFENTFDYALIDTPPTLGNTLVISLLLSQHVLVPMELDFFAIQGLSKLLDTYHAVEKINDNLNYLGIVINKLVTSRKSQQKLYDELLEYYDKKHILNAKIHTSGAIQNALSQGCALKDLRKKGLNVDRRAINEFYALTLEVILKIEKS